MLGCKALPLKQNKNTLSFTVEGVAGTPAVVLLRVPGGAPKMVTLAGQPVARVEHAIAAIVTPTKAVEGSEGSGCGIDWAHPEECTE